MNLRKYVSWWAVAAGAAIGVAAALLSHYGNPPDGGLTVICFERDTAGALSLHTFGHHPFLRPEIFALVFGAFAAALLTRSFKALSAPSAALQFGVGALISFGALLFMG